MFKEELLISAIRQLAEDRELSQLSIVLDNLMDEYNDLLELADTEQERDLITIEMQEITNILTHEIKLRLDRINEKVYGVSLYAEESDDLKQEKGDNEVDELFQQLNDIKDRHEKMANFMKSNANKVDLDELRDNIFDKVQRV